MQLFKQGHQHLLKENFQPPHFGMKYNNIIQLPWFISANFAGIWLITEPTPAEQNNPSKGYGGKRLKTDVWDIFKDRFGVDRIVEIYGASEGNALFMNY